MMISAVQGRSLVVGKKLRMEVAVAARGKALSGKEVIMLSGEPERKSIAEPTNIISLVCNAVHLHDQGSIMEGDDQAWPSLARARVFARLPSHVRIARRVITAVGQSLRRNGHLTCVAPRCNDRARDVIPPAWLRGWFSGYALLLHC